MNVSIVSIDLIAWLSQIGQVVFSQPFHEFLKIGVVEVASLRCVFRVVGECDKRVLPMHLCFVHASNAPLSWAFQSASDALAARQFDLFGFSMSCCLVKVDTTRCNWLICGDRVVAGHSRQPPRIGVIARFAALVCFVLLRKFFADLFLFTAYRASGFMLALLLRD